MKDVAIQEAFYEGAGDGIKDIVEELHEHPAITSEEYATGLILSWNYDKSMIVFPFLLAQADQGDLKEVKKDGTYDEDPDFRKAIDDALSKAPLTGTRHDRPMERAKLVKEAFAETESLKVLALPRKLGPGESF